MTLTLNIDGLLKSKYLGPIILNTQLDIVRTQSPFWKPGSVRHIAARGKGRSNWLCFHEIDRILRRMFINIFTIINMSLEQKHSTEPAVTELIDWVLLNIDNKQVPFAVFMDLSKAFDTLDHKILIDKLQHHGTRGISLMWFESYLSKRTQYV